LTGVFACLVLQSSPRPPSSLAPIKSRMKEFWYRLTQIHLEKAVRMYRDLNNIKTRPRTLVFGFADVTLAGEECLMILR